MNKLFFTLFFSIVSLSTVAQITPKLRSVDCYRSGFVPTYPLYANLTGGTQYKFHVTNTTLGLTDSVISPDRGFSISEMPSISGYNYSYDVLVAIDYGSGFSAYGDVCTVSTATQTAKLRSVDCSRTDFDPTLLLYADLTGGSQYKFRVTNLDLAQTDSVVSPDRAFSISELPSISGYGYTYEVEVTVDFGLGYIPYGSICTVTTKSLDIKLRSSDCSRTDFDPSLNLYANLSTGIQYKFKVTNNDLGLTDSIISSDKIFAISELPALSRYNCTYDIQVAMDEGSGFSDYGDICTVSTMSLTTQLRSADCPRTLTAINYPVYAALTTADSWDFEVRIQASPGTSEQVIGRPDREFRLTMASAPFQQYSTVYEVRVRTVQGGITQEWGGWCEITSPSVTPPEIIDGCDNVFEYLAYEYITCTDIPEATQYRWRLRIGTTQIDTLHSTVNTIRLADFLDASNQPMYDYGQTYNISAQIYDGVQWTSYGNACNIYTTSEPHSEVYEPISPCGSTLASMNTPIYFYAIFNATDYEYEVTDLTGGPYSDGVQVINKATKTMKLNELPNYSYGHDYQVRCAVTFKGTQYSYGSTCTLSAPPATIQLRPSECPKTLLSLGQMFYANNTLTFDNPAGLDPTNTYRFKANGTEGPWQSSRGTNLQTILGTTPAYNTAYTINVQTTYDGTVQAYGGDCVISTPTAIVTKPFEEENLSTKSDLNTIVVYPNPSNDQFNIDFSKILSNEYDKLLLEVFSVNGERVLSEVKSTGQKHSFGSNLKSGMYFVKVRDLNRNELLIQRIIKD